VATTLFIHGLESSNQGTKSVYFRERFPDMMIPNFPGDLDERMAKLRTLLEGKEDIRLVGSSFGGLMATLFAMEAEGRMDRLILLAPAIHRFDELGKAENAPTRILTRIYHGTNDEVIPISKVRKISKKLFLNLSFHPVDDDHFLHNTFKTLDWHHLLKVP
jgi:predicted esterase